MPATGGLPPPRRSGSSAAAADASTSAFHLGIGIAGVLMIVGGIVAGIGIENPTRADRGGADQRRGAGRRVRPLPPIATADREGERPA